MKFGALLGRARHLYECDAVATGHYARRETVVGADGDAAAPPAPRRRRGQGPDVLPVRPAPGPARPRPVPAGRPDEARGAGRRPVAGPRHGRQAREPGDLLRAGRRLPRRAARARGLGARAGAARRRRRRRSSAPHRGAAGYTVGPAAGPRRRARRAALRESRRPGRRTRSSWRAAADLETHLVPLERVSFVDGPPPEGRRGRSGPRSGSATAPGRCRPRSTPVSAGGARPRRPLDAITGRAGVGRGARPGGRAVRRRRGSRRRADRARPGRSVCARSGGGRRGVSRGLRPPAGCAGRPHAAVALVTLWTLPRPRAPGRPVPHGALRADPRQRRRPGAAARCSRPCSVRGRVTPSGRDSGVDPSRIGDFHLVAASVVAWIGILLTAVAVVIGPARRRTQP